MLFRSILTTLSLVLALSFTAGSAYATEDCARPLGGGRVQTPKAIQFDLDSAEIKPEFKAQLEEIAERFAGNPNLDICVIGRADRSGGADYNRELAMKRAEAVADFLKSAGLKDSSYQIVSAGQAYSDDSWLGTLLGSDPSKLNRRVDVIVMQR